jgi:hypothetical protein
VPGTDWNDYANGVRQFGVRQLVLGFSTANWSAIDE